MYFNWFQKPSGKSVVVRYHVFFLNYIKIIYFLIFKNNLWHQHKWYKNKKNRYTLSLPQPTFTHVASKLIHPNRRLLSIVKGRKKHLNCHNIYIYIYILVSTPCISMQHCQRMKALPSVYCSYHIILLYLYFYYIASQNIWAISAITQCFYLIKRLHK